MTRTKKPGPNEKLVSSNGPQKKSEFANLRFFLGETRFVIGCLHCAAVLFSRVPKKRSHLNVSLLYILILRTYSKFAHKKISSAWCFPFRRHAGALAACLPHQDHVYFTTKNCFVSTTMNSMKCLVNWIPLPCSCVAAKHTYF